MKQIMKEVKQFGFPVFRRAGKQAAAEEDDKSMTYQEIETQTSMVTLMPSKSRVTTHSNLN